VRWLGGEASTYAGLAADAVWEIREGDPEPRRLGGAGTGGTGAGGSAAQGPGTVVPTGTGSRLGGPAGGGPGAGALTAGRPGAGGERERLAEFWATERAAMDAMKRDGDLPRAIELFEKALALDPRHEDSRYYLGNCLAAKGDPEGAVAQFEALVRINPQSHRGHLQLGKLLALAATDRAGLDVAEDALQRAAALNPEETGAFQALGEVALLRGDLDQASERFQWVSRTNPRAVGALFLKGYIAWKRGEREEAGRLLEAAQKARGPDWKPRGAVAEGDVARRMHLEGTPTSRFWEQWDGKPDPASAFRALYAFLAAPGRRDG